jgi:hypothetical protein
VTRPSGRAASRLVQGSTSFADSEATRPGEERPGRGAYAPEQPYLNCPSGVTLA